MFGRLQDIFTKFCKQWECTSLEFKGERDHVHLLLSLNPKIKPSAFVNNLKTVLLKIFIGAPFFGRFTEFE